MPAAQQLAKSTAIVLWSDHGYSLGEKEHLWKAAMWERSNRIPMLIHLPGQTEANGSVVDTPVSLIDLYPTLLDLAGIHYPWFLYGQRGTVFADEEDKITAETTRAISLLPMLGDPSAKRLEYDTVDKTQLLAWFVPEGSTAPATQPEANWLKQRYNASFSLLPPAGPEASAVSLPVVTSFVRSEKSTIPQLEGGEVQLTCVDTVNNGSGDYIVHSVRNTTHRWVRYVQGGNTLGHNELFSYGNGHGHLLEVTNLLPGTVSTDLTGALAGPAAGLMHNGFGFNLYQRLYEDYGPLFLGPFKVKKNQKLTLEYDDAGTPWEIDFTVYFDGGTVNGAKLEYDDGGVATLNGLVKRLDVPNVMAAGDTIQARNVRITLAGTISDGEAFCDLLLRCDDCQPEEERDVFLITHRVTKITAVAATFTPSGAKSLTAPPVTVPDFPELEYRYDLAD